MAIDFFKANCKSKTSETEFGIIDLEPSELSFSDGEHWHVTINNPNAREITHTAIDKCLDIPFEEGERCDSMLSYNRTLIFVEIKERSYGRWAGEAKVQLTNTIRLFKMYNDIGSFTHLYGQIANKKRPYFRAGLNNFSQHFEDETGFVLRVSPKILID